MTTNHTTRRTVRALAGLCAAVLAISACGDDDDATDATTTEPTAASPAGTTQETATTADSPATTPADTSATSAATAATTEAPDTAPAEMTEVSFQTFPGLALGVPIQVAQDHGFFEENGLEVSTSDGATGPAMVAALAAGQVDLAGVPNFVAMQSNLAGAGLQTIVGLTGGGGSVLFAGNDIATPTDDYPESAQALNDAVLAASAPGGFSERLYNFLIADAGIEDAQITTVAGVPPSIAALQAGQIDVANFDLISAFRGEQEGAGHLFYDFQTTGPQDFRGASTNAVWATADFIEANPDVVSAFARAIAQADAWLQDPANAEDARAYFSTVAGTDVPDELLAKLLIMLKPIVATADLEAYAQLLDDPSAFDPTTALSSVVPQDDAALEQLVGS